MEYDTSIPSPKDLNDTAGSNRNGPDGYCFWLKPQYNRAVRRYAKKHNISQEEAFKKLCK